MVVRNGYHAERLGPRRPGRVGVRQPRVNDRGVDEVTGERKWFSSVILPAWCRKSSRVAEVVPLLSLHGLSPPIHGPTRPHRPPCLYTLNCDEPFKSSVLPRRPSVLCEPSSGPGRSEESPVGLRLTPRHWTQLPLASGVRGADSSR